MMDIDLIDSWDEDPTLVGWYPTVHCWNVNEGAWPGPMYWNGTEWRFDHGPNGHRGHCQVGWLPFRFDTKEEAGLFAGKNLEGF